MRVSPQVLDRDEVLGDGVFARKHADEVLGEQRLPAQRGRWHHRGESKIQLASLEVVVRAGGVFYGGLILAVWAFLAGSLFGERAVATGARFVPFKPEIDFDYRRLDDHFPERRKVAPGPHAYEVDVRDGEAGSDTCSGHGSTKGGLMQGARDALQQAQVADVGERER